MSTIFKDLIVKSLLHGTNGTNGTFQSAIVYAARSVRRGRFFVKRKELEMIKPDKVLEAFYHTKKWRMNRKAYIAKRILIDGGLCESCKLKLGEHLDHIKELTPENIGDIGISLDHRNLQYLCQECHNKKTKEDKNFNRNPWGVTNFDKCGQPLPPPVKNFWSQTPATERPGQMKRVAKT